MSTLQIHEKNAIAAYNNADDKGKTMLVNLFGDKVFNQKITDRVKSFEDVLSTLGFTKDAFEAEVESCDLSPDEKAYMQIKLIVQALNEGWTPDWNNGNQAKYWPYFNMQDGFSFNGVDSSYRYSTVSSRLCFKSRELAEYAAKQFINIYKAFSIID